MGNIVWLASYPKSGNTWLRAFIYNLIEKPAQPGRIAVLPKYFESESEPKWYIPFLGGKTPEECSGEEIIALKGMVHREIAASRPRGTIFTKTHNRFGSFNDHPLQDISVTAGVIYIVRNPLDVVLSMADHFGLSIDQAIDFMANEKTATPGDMDYVTSVLDSWSNHVESWTHQDHQKKVVIRYEDMLDKPLKAFGQVAKLLGMSKDKNAIKRAIQFSSFSVLKKQESSGGFIERSPKSKSFFRKGRKNQWVNELSDEQVERIVEQQREQMNHFHYIPPKFK